MDIQIPQKNTSQPPVTALSDASENQALLALDGMSCASCAMRIEKGLKKLPGIKEASVNFATEQATVTYDPLHTNVGQMVEKVATLGYSASPLLPQPQTGRAASVTEAGTEAVREEEQNKRKQAELHLKLLLLVLGIALTLPVVLLCRGWDQ